MIPFLGRLALSRLGKVGGIEQFCNIHKDKEALLIGNGKSVDVDNLGKIKSKITFCFNRFHLAYKQTGTHFRPDYVVSIDPQMVKDFGEEIVQQSEAKTLFGVEKRPQLEGDFNFFPIKTTSPFVFSENPTKYVSTGNSVVVATIQLAFYMGMKQIYLYGIDHDFGFDEILNDGEMVMGGDNHFIANYRSGQPWYPPNIKHIEDGFSGADKFLRSRGGFVINCTEGGKLDLLERTSLCDILK